MNIEKIDLPKYLPLATAFLIFSGILHALFYYAYFGLNILPFLEIGEVLLLFLNDMLMVGVGVIVMVVGIYRTLRKAEEISPERIKRAKQLFLTVPIFISLIVCACIFIKYPLRFAAINASAGFVLFLLLFGSPLLLHHLSKRKFVLGLSKTMAFTCFVMLVFLTSFSLGSVLNASVVEYRPDRRAKCTIMLQDERKIQTNDSIVYLGRTRNYIFFHNINSEMNMVVKISDVKTMEVNDVFH